MGANSISNNTKEKKGQHSLSLKMFPGGCFACNHLLWWVDAYNKDYNFRRYNNLRCKLWTLHLAETSITLFTAANILYVRPNIVIRDHVTGHVMSTMYDFSLLLFCTSWMFWMCAHTNLYVFPNTVFARFSKKHHIFLVKHRVQLHA